MSSRKLLCAVLIWGALSLAAQAHQGEVHRPRPTAVSATQASAQPSAGDAADMTVNPKTIASQVPNPIPSPLPVHLQELDWAESLTDHPHNKLVHFPLALGLAACILWVLALRQPGHEPAARLLLVGAALIGVASVLTGQAQQSNYENSPLIEIVAWHEKMGFATLALLMLGAVWQWHASWRKLVWPYGIALVLVILFTGLLGGVLSHGHVEPIDTHAPDSHK